MDNTLVIIGASGHGKVVAEAALASKHWQDVVFLDAQWPNLRHCGPWDVVGADDEGRFPNPMPFVVGIGNAYKRLRVHEHYIKRGWEPQTVIHPAATVSPFATLGAGSVICAGAVVAPFATLGEACIVNTCASVDHDCVLDTAVHIAPGAHVAGEVQIGARTWIGIGSSVIQCIKLGSDILIGAGSAVVGDLQEPGLYLGVPARPVQQSFNR